MLEPAGRVVLVDDDPSILKAYGKQIALMGYSVTPFEKPDEAFHHLESQRAACLVVDLNLPGQSGLDLQKRLNALRPSTPTVFISGAASVQNSVAAMRNGAIHFLEKPVEFDELKAAIDEAISSSRKELQEDIARQAAREKYEELSPRQKDVFMEFLSGAPNKIIAHRLGISERTVKAHRQAVMQKLRAESLADALSVGATLGILRERASDPS